MVKSMWRKAFCQILFLIVASFLVLIFASENPASASQDSMDMGLEVQVDTTIAITINNPEVNLEVVPTKDGVFVHESTDVSVSTNNETGYVLNMSTTTEEDALVSEEDYRILTLETDKTVSESDQSAFTKDRWGYALSSGLVGTNIKFSGMPNIANAVQINSYDRPINRHLTPMTFGAKISTETMNGDYQNTVIFSAITNYVPTFVFASISYLQEMTPEICALETTPSKTARVTTNKTGKGDDFIPEGVLIDERDGNEYIVRKYADGNCWMAQNLKIVGTKQLTNADSDAPYGGDWTLPAPSTSGFAQTSPNGVFVGPLASDAYGNSGQYSYVAATARTGHSLGSGKVATGSICPKGWRLPASTGAKSLQNLLTTVYGITSEATTSPFDFLLVGYRNSTGMNSQGEYGYYWTSDSYSSSQAYTTRVTSAGVTHRHAQNKNRGMSVRCVAR